MKRRELTDIIEIYEQSKRIRDDYMTHFDTEQSKLKQEAIEFIHNKHMENLILFAPEGRIKEQVSKLSKIEPSDNKYYFEDNTVILYINLFSDKVAQFEGEISILKWNKKKNEWVFGHKLKKIRDKLEGYGETFIWILKNTSKQDYNNTIMRIHNIFK